MSARISMSTNMGMTYHPEKPKKAVKVNAFRKDSEHFNMHVKIYKAAAASTGQRIELREPSKMGEGWTDVWLVSDTAVEQKDAFHGSIIRDANAYYRSLESKRIEQ